jgi:hypothetical protein
MTATKDTLFHMQVKGHWNQDCPHSALKRAGIRPERATVGLASLKLPRAICSPRHGYLYQKGRTLDDSGQVWQAYLIPINMGTDFQFYFLILDHHLAQPALL